MTLVIPEILYDNLARVAGASPSYDGASVNPAFPLANCFDWRDWTLFQVQPGTTDIVFFSPGGATVTAFAWFVKALTAADTGFSLRLFWEVSPGVFSPLTDAIDPLSFPQGMRSFSAQVIPAGRRLLVRFVVPGGRFLYVRQLAAGAALIPPIGQQVGIEPPSLQQGWKTSNGVSVNGSLIGRSLVRLLKEYTIDLEYLTPDFCANTWAPFCTHALRFPFFFRWSPRNYPNDCLFASAKSVEAPSYQKPHLMRAKMPLVGLSQ